MRVFAWANLYGSDRDPGNPHLVSDRIWIVSGFPPEMKLSRDNLIRWKNVVVENVERVLGAWERRAHAIVGCMAGNAVPN